MKKIVLIILAFFIISIVGLFSFSSSYYFFNHYIAKNIKEYGFNYTYVKGALFEGFTVEGLTYKNNLLSSNVELKINPLRLLSGVISVNKINLIGVREDVLEEVLHDFQPTQEGEINQEIAFDFELKNIILTVKPFKVKDIKIQANSLSISYLSYLKGRFNIGNVNYEAKTNLGNVNFEGKFEHRVLHIQKITIEKLDLLKVLQIIKGIKSEGTQAEYHLESNPFIPKKIIIKEADFRLVPFSIEGIKSKKLLLHLNDSIFNISKLVLEKASLAFNYNGNYLALNTKIGYKDNFIKIQKIDLKIKKLEKIETLIRPLIKINENSKTNDNTVKIVPIDKIKIGNGKVVIAPTTYRGEKINSFNFTLNNFLLNLLQKKIIALKKYSIDLNTSLISLKSTGDINTSNNIDFITFAIPNSDNLIQFIQSLNKKNNTPVTQKQIKLPIPDKIYIKKVKGVISKLSFTPYRIKKGIVKGSNIGIDINKSSIFDGNLTLDTNSNWGRAKLEGQLKENNYFAKGFCKPNQVLLDQYSLPLKAKSFDTIFVKSRFGLKNFDINATLKGKDILKKLKNISIIDSQNRIQYNYFNNSLVWSMSANISSPYLKKSKLHNILIYKNDKMNYKGNLKSANIAFLNKPYTKLFKNIEAKYNGNSKNLNISFLSTYLKGSASIINYNKAFITVENREKLFFKDFMDLPKNYNEFILKNMIAEATVNFSKPLPLKGNIKAITNMGILTQNWIYNKDIFNMKGEVNISKNSLLFQKYPKLNKKSIQKLETKLNYKKEKLLLEIKNKLLKADILYNIKNNSFKNTTIQVDKLNVNLNGNIDSIDVSTKITSIKKVQYSLKKFYTFKINSNIDGKLEFNAQLKNLSLLNFVLLSPKIIYLDKKKQIDIKDIYLQGEINNKNLAIKKYSSIIKGYKIYSNKTSLIDISDIKNIRLQPLWINDSLQIVGNYAIEQRKGKFKLNSNNFKLENSDVVLNLGLDTKVAINKEKIVIKGVIVVLDGMIKKIIGQKNVAENSDIIILQRQKNRESTKFAKNIKLNIKIKSKKGILYKQGGNKIRILPNLTIKKEFNRLSQFNGKATIGKNSYYYLNGKKLVVEKGDIIFKGKSMSPNLDIILKYKGREYTIKINIVGTPTHPVLYFSSEPALNKDQILAYLLFDDASAAGTHDQAAMLNTIGGSIAKSFLGSLGIEIDHISIKENGFSIGKSFGKHVIIYYNQENQEPSVKARVDISKSIHTDIEIGKDKQSADVVFSKDY